MKMKSNEDTVSVELKLKSGEWKMIKRGRKSFIISVVKV